MKYIVEISRMVYVSDAESTDDAEKKAREDVLSSIEDWGPEDAVDEFAFEATQDK